MKKKIYYIIYSIIQLLVGIYTFICAKDIVDAQVELLEKTFSTIPGEYSEIMTEMFSGSDMVLSTRLFALVAVVFSVVLLVLAVKNKMLEKKGVTIGLLIASMFLLNDLVLIMAVVALILVLNTKTEEKKEKVLKEKKEIQKLRTLKVTSKDYIWAIVLMLAYCTQFIVPYLVDSLIVAIIFEIVFYVGIFALVIYVFAKRFKRDFNALKENVGTYVGYIFKWWGIMLGFSVIAAIIRLVLGGEVVTANQTTLNGLPLWYVVPLSVIWAPIVEEGIFRGVLRRFVKNDKLFIILSAGIFGLLHTLGSEVGLYNMLIQSLQYMVMGGVMAYVYVKTNNIFTNIGIHCIQNSMGAIFMILMSLM